MEEDGEKQQCAHTISGPKVGKNVVAWRRKCQRMVKGEPYCWQHRAAHRGEDRRASWPSRGELSS